VILVAEEFVVFNYHNLSESVNSFNELWMLMK